MFDTRHADRVRSDAVHGFQMLRMHQKSGKFIAVHLQSEQHAESDIINAALHRTVHCLRVVRVIMLRSGRMQVLIALLVVGLLKQDVGSDSGFF